MFTVQPLLSRGVRAASNVGLFFPVMAAAGDIIEGKRTKKSVERLDFQAPKQKEKLKIGDGKYLTLPDTYLVVVLFLAMAG